MVVLHRKLNFSKDPEGVQHFRGGGGGVSNFFQMLISIEIHITCGFPGGSPLDQHMIPLNKIFLVILACYLALGLILSTGYVAHLHSDI